MIGEAVFARCLSAMKEERVEASKTLGDEKRALKLSAEERADILCDLRHALFAAKIVSYAQGYTLMRSAAKTYGWNLNYGCLLYTSRCV